MNEDNTIGKLRKTMREIEDSGVNHYELFGFMLGVIESRNPVMLDHIREQLTEAYLEVMD